MPDMSPNAGLPRIFVVLAWMAWLGGATQAWAADAVDPAAQTSQLELQQLGQQRAEIEARFKAESLLCEQRFAVNDCLNRVRAERSLALKPIVTREQEIDKLERQARAEAQRQRVIEREQEAARLEAQRRMAELLAAQREALRRSEPAEAEPEPAPAEAVVAKPRPSVQEIERAQRAKKLRADQEAERRLAQRQAFERQQAAHQREAQQRMAQREAESKGKKAPSSLPIPSAAEIAAASQSAASAGKR